MHGQPHSAHILPQNSQGPLWMPSDLLISRAIMLWIFLLQLINSLTGLSGAEHETLCTSNACFTLHMDSVSFAKAHQNCVDSGGHLMTIRDKGEEDVLRSLLSQIQRQHQDVERKFWIGLKLNKLNCVYSEKILKGFKWVSGKENSHYSNWGQEPISTCTKERCVSVRYTSLDHNQLKWFDGACRGPAFYACKFNFKGMCKPLALLGPGQITYIAPFSEKPLRSRMKSLPLGTYAEISCGDQEAHYSVCTGADDIYRWTVPGPFCKTENPNCTINNGGCQHVCLQGADEVRCLCGEGYELDEDGFSCRRENLCGADTCEHQCVMTESEYSCKCQQGFKLHENQRNCSDVDECQSEVCEGHLCVNTHGSYKCVCEEGYKLIHGKCSDVDECAQSKCEQLCFNSAGSFSCFCNDGFTLSPDGHSCVDINECISLPCQFTCINTPGSFWCACQRGFHLEADGSTCAPDVTETSAAPPDDPGDDQTRENFTESLTRTAVELQHQSPHTDPPLSDLVNVTHRVQEGNTSLVTDSVKPVNSKVIICVLGSVIPLLALIAVTLAIAIFRCSRSKKEAKKNATTDGYCWVSSGLDPRLEKLYESILTDDL